MIEFLPEPAGWAREAACTQSDPEAWFPSTGESGSRSAREAKRICKDICPVRAQCLEATLAMDELPRYGIWAGHNVADLRQLKNPNRVIRPRHRPEGVRAACGTYAGWKAHQKHKDAMCDPCREARNAYQRDYRTKGEDAA